MFDPRREDPLLPHERWMALGLAAAIAAAIGADLVSDFHPVKLSIPFMIAAWAPLLVLHEAGHALAARWVGFRIDEIVIGFGRTLDRRRVAGLPVELRVLPVEGFVRCRPRELSGVRWKSAFVYLAGPGVELLLALALALAVGTDELLRRSEDVATIACQSVALASVLGCVLNLLPHSSFGPAGELPSDGLGILWSLSRSERDWAREMLRREHAEAARERDLP